MNKINKKGVSLIALLVMILIMIIIAGTAIVSLTENNPIKQTKVSVRQSDMVIFKEEYNTYLANQYKRNPYYDKKVINATAVEHLETQNDDTEDDRTDYPDNDLNHYIPSYRYDHYKNLLEIKDGEVYFDEEIAKNLEIDKFLIGMFKVKNTAP